MESNQPGTWHKMEACVLAGPAMLPDTLGGRVTKQQSTQKCLLLLVPEHAKCSHPHEKQQDWIQSYGLQCLPFCFSVPGLHWKYSLIFLSKGSNEVRHISAGHMGPSSWSSVSGPIKDDMSLSDPQSLPGGSNVPHVIYNLSQVFPTWRKSIPTFNSPGIRLSVCSKMCLKDLLLPPK